MPRDGSESRSGCPVAPGQAGWPRPSTTWRPKYAPLEPAVIDGTPTDPPRCPWLPDRLPAPWIGGLHPHDSDDWHSFRDDAVRCHHERLCAICGEPMGERVLLGSMDQRKMTAGPGGHPRCIALAVATCPHLAQRRDDPDAVVAYEYVGDDVGYLIVNDDQLHNDYGSGEDIHPDARPLTRAQVQQIALRDPLGDDAATRPAADTLTA